MFVVCVEFTVKRECGNLFLKRVLKQAADSLAFESECHTFDVCSDPKDTTRIFLYEVYQGEESFLAHLKTSHFKSFDAEVGPWVEHKTVATYLRHKSI